MPLERVLYVEDEPDIREIARIALVELGGLNVDLCASGGEALAAVEALHPDLILLDVMMPDMDGTETFRRLRDKPDLAETPIVFMTARAQDHEVRQYHELGAAGVITKPFDPIALPAQLRALWDASSGEHPHG